MECFTKYSMQTIPVIILNYNSSADCRQCVADLKRQEGVELDIVIVDNCSPREGEQELIKQLCAEEGCTFIQAKENRGYNAGNNIGLRYAAEKGYKYALIANPDMRFPQEDYVAQLVKVMDEMPDVAVCGSDIVSLEGVHQNPMKRDGDWRSSFGWVTVFFRKKKSDTYDFIDNYAESHDCSKVSGCCLLVRMDFMKRIGYFDERVFLYCEEAILSRQVERCGMTMHYIADVQAIHAHVKNEKGDPIMRFGHWRKSRVYFIDNYSEDCCFGRMMAKLSMGIYVVLMTMALRIKACIN